MPRLLKLCCRVRASLWRGPCVAGLTMPLPPERNAEPPPAILTFTPAGLWKAHRAGHAAAGHVIAPAMDAVPDHLAALHRRRAALPQHPAPGDGARASAVGVVVRVPGRVHHLLDGVCVVAEPALAPGAGPPLPPQPTPPNSPPHNPPPNSPPTHPHPLSTPHPVWGILARAEPRPAWPRAAQAQPRALVVGYWRGVHAQWHGTRFTPRVIFVSFRCRTPPPFPHLPRMHRGDVQLPPGFDLRVNQFCVIGQRLSRAHARQRRPAPVTACRGMMCLDAMPRNAQV